MRSAKRRAWRLTALVAFCIVLGALTTVAFAWYFARWRSADPPSATTQWSHEGKTWLYQSRNSATATRLDGTPATAWAASNSLFSIVAPPNWSRMSKPPGEDDQAARIIDEAFGWPLRSLCCTYARHPNLGPRGWFTAANAIEVSVQHPVDRNRFLALPLKPIWPGFLASTFLFAAMWFPLTLLGFLVLRLLFTARSRWRRRHGRCPACGYQLQTRLDAGCPECGWNREHAQAN